MSAAHASYKLKWLCGGIGCSVAVKHVLNTFPGTVTRHRDTGLSSLPFETIRITLTPHKYSPVITGYGAIRDAELLWVIFSHLLSGVYYIVKYSIQWNGVHLG